MKKQSYIEYLRGYIDMLEKMEKNSRECGDEKATFYYGGKVDILKIVVSDLEREVSCE